MNCPSRMSVMTRNTLMGALAAILLALSPSTALATDIRLVNYVSYTYSNNTATLSTDGVQNFDRTISPIRCAWNCGRLPRPMLLEQAGCAWPPMRCLLGPRRPDREDRLRTGAVRDAAGRNLVFLDDGDGIRGNRGQRRVRRPLLDQCASLPSTSAFRCRRTKCSRSSSTTPPSITISSPAMRRRSAISTRACTRAGTRTGYVFNVWDGAGIGINPVCRYYIPPGYGDSHFFSGSLQECTDTGTKFPWLVDESSAAFYIALPIRTRVSARVRAFPSTASGMAVPIPTIGIRRQRPSRR